MNRRRFLASSTAASALATSLVNISSDGAEMKPLCEASLTTCSATELAWLIRHGRVSVEQVVTEHIDRIGRVDPAINAVVQKTFDSAMRHAQATDEAIRHGNIDWKRKPLLGVPITIKDAFDVEGLPTICGVPARQRAPATSDATAVARLKAAGAIVLGKTNVPALCMHFETDNCVFGQTSNPYDVTRTPGGSSGGEAAIIAACGSPLGLGSDGGGSIRTPAHFCGLAGIRPGWGRVSLAGSFPTPPQAYGNYYTAGPLARCVEDLALALHVLSGQDPRDPFTFPVPLLDYRDVSIPDLRICYWTECERADTTAETQHTVRQAAEALHDAGAEVKKRRPPHWNKTDTILDALYDTEVTTFETMLKTFGIDEPQTIDLQAVEFARKHWGQISPERSKQAIEQWLPMFQLAIFVPGQLGWTSTSWACWWWIPLNGTLDTVSEILRWQVSASFLCLCLLALLVFLRVVFRSELFAMFAVVIFLCIVLFDRESWVTTLVQHTLTWTTLLLLVLRFGLLAFVVGWYTLMLLQHFPLTVDSEHFYFGSGLLATTAVTALALYGFYITIGGRAGLKRLRV